MDFIHKTTAARDGKPPLELKRRGDGAVNNLSGTNLERAGDYNQRVVLQAIRIHEPITRAELSRTTGLTAPAVANIARRLIQLGLVAEAGKRQGERGQPATKLVIDPDGCFSLGVHIEKDRICVLVLDLLGRVRARVSQDGRLAGPLQTAEQVGTLVETLLAKPGLRRTQLIGIGVALSALPADQTLPTWADVDVASLFAQALAEPARGRLPVFVEHDAAAAAQGESQFGLGLAYDSFFYVLIGAGLGGGLVVNGDYFRGAHGRSGETGPLSIHADRAGCGSLEDAVSLTGLFKHLAGKGFSVSTPSHLADLGADGRVALDAWVDEAADLLTEPLLASSWLINPAAILLGGQLPKDSLERLAHRLSDNLRRRSPTSPVLAPVRPAALAEDAQAAGAAILPFLSDLLPSRSSLMKV